MLSCLCIGFSWLGFALFAFVSPCFPLLLPAPPPPPPLSLYLPLPHILRDTRRRASLAPLLRRLISCDHSVGRRERILLCSGDLSYCVASRGRPYRCLSRDPLLAATQIKPIYISNNKPPSRRPAIPFCLIPLFPLLSPCYPRFFCSILFSSGLGGLCLVFPPYLSKLSIPFSVNLARNITLPWFCRSPTGPG